MLFFFPFPSLLWDTYQKDIRPKERVMPFKCSLKEKRVATYLGQGLDTLLLYVLSFKNTYWNIKTYLAIPLINKIKKPKFWCSKVMRKKEWIFFTS